MVKKTTNPHQPPTHIPKNKKDGNGDFTKAMGLELDGRGFGLGNRSQRFALIAVDGIIKV